MKNITRYTDYQNSGEAWLGDLPLQWKVIKTKNLFRLITNPAPIGNSEELLSVYTALGVRPRKDLEQRGNKASTTDNYWLVKKGDIIVNKLLAWMGAIGISNYDGVTSPAYDILRPQEGVNPTYYNYLFRSPFASREFKRHSRGIMDMRLRLYFSRFGDIKLPYPSVDEQEAISRFLNFKLAKMERFVRKKQQLIKLLNEQKAAIITQVITKGLVPNVPMKNSSIERLGKIPEHWQEKKMKYLANCFPSNVDKHIKEGERQVRLCNYTDVYKNDFITNDMSLMFASATDEQIGKFSLLIGDVVFTKDSETANDIAIPAYVKEELENVVCGYHLSVLRPYSELLGEFLFRALQCKTINTQFEVCSNGVTRVGLGVYDMKKAKIPVPPINEQVQIIDFISKETETIYSTISKIEKEIALTQEYRTALITEAVTGKIDVRSYQLSTNEEEEVFDEEPLNFVAEEEAE